MEMVDLKWEGPFTFKELLQSKEYKKKYCCSGVYLWVIDGRSRIQYVGKSEISLWKRQFEHYIRQIGGHYMILKDFSHTGSDWNCSCDKDEVLEILFNEHEFKNIVASGFSYAKEIKIYFSKINKEKLRDIERNLLVQLHPETTYTGTQSPPQIPLKFNHIYDAVTSSEDRDLLQNKIKYAQ